MLYIHIPFCVSKCVYCDFLSQGVGCVSDISTARQMEAYVRALLDELRAARLGDMRDFRVETIYIGGGTPTALPASFLCEIIGEARRFLLAPGVEITVEMNPASLLHGNAPDVYLRALREAGVNRLSIGLQAFEDTLLAQIGRAHTVQDFLQTYQAARATGFDNINVDLMFALPEQTAAMWCEGVQHLIALKPEHISAYSLTPAENTPLWDAVTRGETLLPDDDTDREMYHAANRLLAAAGYTRYEISNFALAGCESRHNVNTWLRRPYRGFGLGAHSFENETRWNNTEDMQKYLCGGDIREEIYHLTQGDALAEKMILGLRLAQGVPLSAEIRARYGAEIKKLISDDLLVIEGERIKLTTPGTDLANQVFTMFI